MRMRKLRGGKGAVGEEFMVSMAKTLKFRRLELRPKTKEFGQVLLLGLVFLAFSEICLLEYGKAAGFVSGALAMAGIWLVGLALAVRSVKA